MSITTSCHCGAVAATFEGPVTEGMRCNCSICRRKGHVLAFMPRDALKAATDGHIATYTFNKGVIRHQFCDTCGCSPFGEGEMPDGTKMAAVNLNCVDGFDLGSIKITEVDGAKF